MSAATPGPESGWRDDGVTVIAARSCRSCGRSFSPSGRRIWCSNACRQRDFRRRHPTPTMAFIDPPARVPKAATVYECPGCFSRYLGEQFCAECRLFCRRVGPGGECPSCHDPVAVIDLIEG